MLHDVFVIASLLMAKCHLYFLWCVLQHLYLKGTASSCSEVSLVIFVILWWIISPAFIGPVQCLLCAMKTHLPVNIVTNNGCSIARAGVGLISLVLNECHAFPSDYLLLTPWIFIFIIFAGVSNRSRSQLVMLRLAIWFNPVALCSNNNIFILRESVNYLLWELY